MFYGLLAYFITICILIIAYALIYHHFDRNEEECKDPVILKKKIQKELKEEDEYLLNNLINAQNLNIRYAMKHNRNECSYGFYEYYKQLYPNRYKDEFTEVANEYYKKYKIDVDKISWD